MRCYQPCVDDCLSRQSKATRGKSAKRVWCFVKKPDRATRSNLKLNFRSSLQLPAPGVTEMKSSSGSAHSIHFFVAEGKTKFPQPLTSQPYGGALATLRHFAYRHDDSTQVFISATRTNDGDRGVFKC